ncbi:endoglucanase [Talaromyces pinophilus]|uniref:Endoglucanase n=1 Tax=Talaromyces pinophilus TaxID=128442 RepID=A0A6V8H9L5_TALPI|nr:Barwin-related endoglucanase [Penicillium occitanis (nom. inval.)]PCH09704.1 hypothetical protein PENOC_008220 [Penicillium occitanis (nom. inval.)]GAM37971.1 endoglucanase [Talaromyces pinophilus]
MKLGYLAHLPALRYYDGQEGACGCGTSSGIDSWQLGISSGVYTAAGSQAFFDTAGATWCGAGCGKCYNLTSTGSSPCNGCGLGGVAGESIIVMVTNLCPYNGNQQWCPQVGGTNQYGYSYHFDIMAQSEIFGDNVVVNFEPVACPGQATSDWETWFQQLIFDVSHADNNDKNVDVDLEFSWCDADGVRTMRRKWLDWRDDLCGGFHL